MKIMDDSMAHSGDMLARFERLFCMGKVQVVRRGDMHHIYIRVGQQRLTAGPKRLRIVDDLCGHVAGIARRTKIRNMRLEHLPHRPARLR